MRDERHEDMRTGGSGGLTRSRIVRRLNVPAAGGESILAASGRRVKSDAPPPRCGLARRSASWRASGWRVDYLPF
jgi:hypothetical protein